MLLETAIANAILIWGVSEGLVTWVDVNKPLQPAHEPSPLDSGEAPIGSG